jgi:hypothetical protein
MEKQTLRFTTLLSYTQKAFCFNDFPPVSEPAPIHRRGIEGGWFSPAREVTPSNSPSRGGEPGVWIPKSLASVERLNTYDYRVTVPKWFVEQRNLQKRVVHPDSRAAYDHWNEEGDYHYYSEHPEIFGRGAGYDYPEDDDRFPDHPNFIDGDEYQ